MRSSRFSREQFSGEHLTRREALKAGAAAVPMTALACASASGVIRPVDATDAGGAMAPRADYVFDIEQKTVSPLGVPVTGMLVNGSQPGPEIRYTEGDMFRVLLQNKTDTETTVHWHGLIVPNWMDGVPNITQLPIQPGQSFFVEYPIVQSGSYWYHSHVGLQEQIGLHGPYIIEERNPLHDYDHDVVCFSSDWLNQSPYGIIPQIRGEQPATEAVKTPSGDRYNLPGATKPYNVDVNYPGFLLNGRANDAPWTFQANKGDRIRLRLINGATSATFRVALDGHEMTIIACDGTNCAPRTVDSLVIAVAERYDVLVTVKETGAFTLHYAALGQAQQVVGVIHTPDAAPKPNMARPTFGPRTGGMADYGMLRATGNSQWPDGPVKQFEIELGGEMKQYLWSMAGKYYPELYVPKNIGDNVPLDIELGQRVRVRFTNSTMMYHPMHLHGHFFRLLATPGDWDQPDAVIKDTVCVGPGQVVDIEFYADNPGHWFFHCHNLYHLATGMARQFHYGVNPVGRYAGRA